MKSLNPLIVFAVVITSFGVYQNWSAAFTEAWWFAVAGGVCLAILYFATRYSSIAMGILGLVLLLLGLFNVAFVKAIDRSMISGLAVGLLAGISAGFAVKSLRARQGQARKE